MNSHKIFCMCLNSHHLENLKKLEYIPVGLGKQNYDSEWFRDNTGDNISSKNPFYGEYTFYYWIWKNFLKIIQIISGSVSADIDIIGLKKVQFVLKR